MVHLGATSWHDLPIVLGNIILAHVPLKRLAPMAVFAKEFRDAYHQRRAPHIASAAWLKDTPLAPLPSDSAGVLSVESSMMNTFNLPEKFEHKTLAGGAVARCVTSNRLTVLRRVSLSPSVSFCLSGWFQTAVTRGKCFGFLLRCSARLWWGRGSVRQLPGVGPAVCSRRYLLSGFIDHTQLPQCVHRPSSPPAELPL
jgi:hypothetical protein